MKKGDIIINPYALKDFYGRLNPNYAVIYVKRDTINGIIDCIDYEGKKRKFYVSKAEEEDWEVVGHINFNLNFNLYDAICNAIDWSKEDA